MAPAPPPPAPAPAPTLSAPPASLPNRSALLKSIEKGTKLKKAITNDRSAPLIGTQSNSTANNSSEAGKRSSSSGMVTAAASAAPAGLGGLFANGFPKLRPVDEKRKGASMMESAKTSVASVAATSAVNTAKASVTTEARKIASSVASKKPDPPPASSLKTADAKSKPKSPVASAPAPPPLPKKEPKPKNTSTSGIEAAMAKTSISNERWTFPDNVEKLLPPPRKFTNCKKVYLSAQEASYSTTNGTGEEINLDDIDTFIDSLNSKLKKAVADENFEECVRIKGKLKKLDELKKTLKGGGKVFSSDLP